MWVSSSTTIARAVFFIREVISNDDNKGTENGKEQWV